MAHTNQRHIITVPKGVAENIAKGIQLWWANFRPEVIQAGYSDSYAVYVNVGEGKAYDKIVDEMNAYGRGVFDVMTPGRIPQ